MAKKPVKQPGRPAKRATRKYAKGGLVANAANALANRQQYLDQQIAQAESGVAPGWVQVPVPIPVPVAPTNRYNAVPDAEKLSNDAWFKAKFGYARGGPVRHFADGGPTDEELVRLARIEAAQREMAFRASPGVLYEQPAGIPEQQRAQQVQGALEGAQAIGRAIGTGATSLGKNVVYDAGRVRDAAEALGRANVAGAPMDPATRAAVARANPQAAQPAFRPAKPGILSLIAGDIAAPSSGRRMLPSVPSIDQIENTLFNYGEPTPATFGSEYGVGKQRPAGQNVPPVARAAPANTMSASAGAPGVPPSYPGPVPGNSALMTSADIQAMAPDPVYESQARSALAMSRPVPGEWRSITPEDARAKLAARPASPGEVNQQGATRADGTAVPVPPSSRVNVVSSGALGEMAGGFGARNSQGDYDNALLAKWYSLAPNERGNAPPSVLNAMHRGANDQATAMNVARAQIMDAGLPPALQARELAKLEAVQSQIDDQLAQSGHMTRADENAATQTSNTALAAARRDAILGKQYDAQGRRWDAQTAAEQAAQPSEIDARKAAAEAARSGALTATARQQAEQRTSDAALAASEFAPRPTFDAKAMAAINPLGTPAGNKQYADLLAAQQDEYDTGRQVLATLEAANPGKTRAEVIRLAAAKAPVQYRQIMNAFPHGFAAGGPVLAPVYGGVPTVPRVDPLVQAFRDYTAQAQAAGVPTVPFAQFMQIKSGGMQSAPQPGAMAMARGGAVPVGGKMVVDTDQDAEADSIPAVIDGKHPAALDSGEFVFTKDATAYYGTKFLNGMLEKARAGATGNAASAR